MAVLSVPKKVRPNGRLVVYESRDQIKRSIARAKEMKQDMLTLLEIMDKPQFGAHGTLTKIINGEMVPVKEIDVRHSFIQAIEDGRA